MQGEIKDLRRRNARSHHVDLVVEPVESLLTVDAMPSVPDTHLVQSGVDGVGEVLGTGYLENAPIGDGRPPFSVLRPDVRTQNWPGFPTLNCELSPIRPVPRIRASSWYLVLGTSRTLRERRIFFSLGRSPGEMSRNETEGALQFCELSGTTWFPPSGPRSSAHLPRHRAGERTALSSGAPSRIAATP